MDLGIKRAFNNLPLSWKILCGFLSVCCALTAASGIVHYRYSRNVVEQSIREQAFALCERIEREFALLYATPVEHELRLLVTSPQLNNYLMSSREERLLHRAEVERLFLSLSQGRDLYVATTFLDAAGHEQIGTCGSRRARTFRSLAEMQNGDIAGRNLRTLFAELKSGRARSLACSAPFWDTEGRLSILVGMVKQEPEAGGFGGAVVQHCNLTGFIRGVSQRRILGAAVVRIYNSDGTALSVPLAEELRQAPRAGHDGAGGPVGDCAYTAQCRFLADAAPTLTVVCSVPRAVISRQLTPVIQSVVVIFSVLLAGAVVSSLLISRWISGRIRTLTKAAKNVSAQRLDVDLDTRLTESVDEIGILAHAFRTMLRDLQESTTSIDSLNREVTQRKEAEAALRRERDRAQRYLDTAGVMLVALNEKGRITLINRKGSQILGYEEQELLGKDWFETCLPSQAQGSVRAVFERLRAGEIEAARYAENAVRTRSGEERLMAWHNTVLTDDTGRIIGALSSGEDITERRKAEEELRRGEERLRQQTALLRNVLAHIPYFVFWKDLDSVYLGCNEVFARSAGVEGPDDIVGKTDYDLVWKNEAPLYRQCDKQVMDGGVSLLNFEEPQTREDGRQITLLTSKVPLRDADGRVAGVLGIYTDITERKSLEDALRESETRFRSVVEQAGDGFELLDEQGRFVDMNSATCRALGYTKEELLGLSVSDINPVVSREQYAALLQSMAGQPPKTFESVHRRQDGTTFPVEITISLLQLGGVLRCVALVRDITERKQAELRIRRDATVQAAINKLLGLSLENLTLEEILQQAIDHITSAAEFALEAKGAIFLADDAQETLVLAAQRGLAPPLVAHCARVPFGTCVCGRAAQSHDLQFLDRLEEIHEYTFADARPHGHYCAPILSAGKVLGVLTTYVQEGHTRSQDEEDFLRSAAAVLAGVIRRKQAEDRQARLLQKLSEINQELKEFAYVVSHDLKAPLRAIRTLAEWLAADYQDKLDAQGKETLQLLGGRVDRMQNLIDGVLQYSRIGRTEQAAVPVCLAQLLPEIVEDLSVPAHIAVHLEDPLPTITADPTRITQVFQNLLSNAIKYTDKPQGQIMVGCVAEGGFWQFHVRDNGPGIEEKHFERIFKLFQTLAPRDGSESTGVGLTITKKIVETYGGRIWVESEVGRGSTFFFTFPQAPENAVPETLQPCAAGQV
ncbi:MAG: PAS domain S-box protein [Planctomycetes bacterium]|jgi:PAS domain S-box-containing protein|nr:PAS domain S-box protein [Planctomycetota bacterium]